MRSTKKSTRAYGTYSPNGTSWDRFVVRAELPAVGRDQIRPVQLLDHPGVVVAEAGLPMSR